MKQNTFSLALERCKKHRKEILKKIIKNLCL